MSTLSKDRIIDDMSSYLMQSDIEDLEPVLVFVEAADNTDTLWLLSTLEFPIRIKPVSASVL